MCGLPVCAGSFDARCALVRKVLQADPLEGSLFVN
jgi:hypothetical protein